MHGLQLRIVTLLAVLALLVSGGSAADTHYLCHFTGRVAASCCCTAKSPPSAKRSSQQVRPADCCDRIVTAARSGATGTRDASQNLPAASLVAILPPDGYAPLAAQTAGTVVRSARAPPAAGPPLFIAHCALLI